MLGHSWHRLLQLVNCICTCAPQLDTVEDDVDSWDLLLSMVGNKPTSEMMVVGWYMNVISVPVSMCVKFTADMALESKRHGRSLNEKVMKATKEIL